ncbi:MAG: hypothetical protein H0U95_00525 [Bacteroidetes bacterium]|nr:hypothetical protein [Bacteroidota bacterium]
MIISQKQTNTFLFCAVVAFLHFIIGIIGILNHEIWLDEAHHFLLAKDSSGLIDLYRNAAYDGHPLLWDGLLFLLTRFSASVFYMQLLNVIIMSATVFLFLKHAPFKKLISVLIVFGYFFIYEYHVISRNYAISVLFLTLVFVQLNKPAKNHLLLSLYLLLLSLTHIYSIIVVVALCLILILQNKNSKLKYLYAGIILITALILFSLKVPADHFLFKFDTDHYLSFKRIGKAFSVYLKGFLPIPDFTVAKIWNTNLMVSFSKILATVLSFIFALIPFFIFKKEKIALFFFYFSTLAICLFIYFSPILVATRHCGFIFVILIFAFWLQNILYTGEIVENGSYKTIVLSILVLHILSGIYLFVTDLQQPFSNAKNVANYLKENKLEQKEIYLSNLSSGPAISAYLDKKIIYLETGEKNSFCKWNTWPFILNKDQLKEKISTVITNDTCILILNNSYIKENLGVSMRDILPDFNIISLKQFNTGMVTSEKYQVYELVKK